MSQLPAAEVVGVDGCPGGWVAIVLSDGAVADAAFAARFGDLLAAIPTGTLVAVDIPIGLPERGWRKADAAARQFLHGQASSVFSTPPRPVVEASQTTRRPTVVAESSPGRGSAASPSRSPTRSWT